MCRCEQVVSHHRTVVLTTSHCSVLHVQVQSAKTTFWRHCGQRKRLVYTNATVPEPAKGEQFTAFQHSACQGEERCCTQVPPIVSSIQPGRVPVWCGRS